MSPELDRYFYNLVFRGTRGPDVSEALEAELHEARQFVLHLTRGITSVMQRALDRAIRAMYERRAA